MASTTKGLRLDEATQKRLEALSKTRDRSPHYLMKQAVERFLDTEEAIEAERRLVYERWDRFALTGEAIDHGQVKRWAANLIVSKTSPKTPTNR